MTNVTFDEEKLRRLKKAYDEAVKNQKDSFFFDGQEYLTSYAKYLIEFLTTKFKK